MFSSSSNKSSERDSGKADSNIQSSGTDGSSSKQDSSKDSKNSSKNRDEQNEHDQTDENVFIQENQHPNPSYDPEKTKAKNLETSPRPESKREAAERQRTELSIEPRDPKLKTVKKISIIDEQKKLERKRKREQRKQERRDMKDITNRLNRDDTVWNVTDEEWVNMLKRQSSEVVYRRGTIN